MKKNLKRIICTLLSVLLIFGMLAGCSNDVAVSVPETTTEQTTQESLAIATDTNVGSTEPVTISEEVQQLADDTKEAVEQKQDIATDELAPVPDDESEIVDEGAIEPDAQVEQENISYDGTNTGNGLSLLGKCTGLTYYSQADSRWANLPYTSTGNKSQTMKSSACGPTCAAMVVSSSKGAILPTTMAQLFVDNGYRTRDNGTAWAAFPFVADYFDFNEYHTTSNFNTMLNYLKQDKNKDGIADYFVVVSVGSGAFTTGGHYIVLIEDVGSLIGGLDPFNYSGKYTTASRRDAHITVSGNKFYISEGNFKKYANAKQYWIFSNDNKAKHTSNTNNKKPITTTVSYTRYVATQSQNLNVRIAANTSAKIVTTLKKGTKVIITQTNGSWSYITSPTTGWVSTAYLSAAQVNTSNINKTLNSNTAPSFKIGNTYTLTTNVKVRSGAGTNYAQKKRSQLTVDGRKHAFSQTYAVLKSGTKFTVQQVRKNGSDIWVKIPSGWICVYYRNISYAK